MLIESSQQVFYLYQKEKVQWKVILFIATYEIFLIFIYIFLTIKFDYLYKNTLS